MGSSVRVDNLFFEKRLLTCDIPQGYLLGPLIFLIYSTSFYADDTKVYANLISHLQPLQKDLISINKWCSEWIIPLNVLYWQEQSFLIIPSEWTVIYLRHDQPYIFSVRTTKNRLFFSSPSVQITLQYKEIF